MPDKSGLKVTKSLRYEFLKNTLESMIELTDIRFADEIKGSDSYRLLAGIDSLLATGIKSGELDNVKINRILEGVYLVFGHALEIIFQDARRAADNGKIEDPTIGLHTRNPLRLTELSKMDYFTIMYKYLSDWLELPFFKQEFFRTMNDPQALKPIREFRDHMINIAGPQWSVQSTGKTIFDQYITNGSLRYNIVAMYFVQPSSIVEANKFCVQDVRITSQPEFPQPKVARTGTEG